MIKRIPSRVVSSVSLDEIRNLSQRPGQPRDIGNISDVNFDYAGNETSYTYTDRLEITKVSVCNVPAGQIIDCLV